LGNFADRLEGHGTIAKRWQKEVFGIGRMGEELALDDVELRCRRSGIIPSLWALRSCVSMAVLVERMVMPIRDWKGALNRFAIDFEGRMPT
jgi:transposase-like protein